MGQFVFVVVVFLWMREVLLTDRTVWQSAAYRKILKISPGASIFHRPFLRGLSTEGNLRFKIEWASLLFGSKFTVFALFYLAFEGNFPSTSPRGAYNWRGNLREGFLRYWFEGLHYIWRGLYMEGLIFGILRGTAYNYLFFWIWILFSSSKIDIHSCV